VAVEDEAETLVPEELLDDIVPREPLIDYSLLPPATLSLTLPLAENGTSEANLTMREGNSAAIIDVFREDIAAALSLRISEAEYSGNQSPWNSGQISVENDGLIEFAAGQERARLSISLRSNPVREPDREVVLRIQDTANPTADLARLNLVLEDDDQRAFEEGLPVNTVAFAVNQISVREFDPAAQIDVIRYNPDNTAMEVGYVLLDVTATEGQDYFTPGSTLIYFAAGQRTARILVPLGQDARREPDEAFMLELETEPVSSDSNIFSQIAVMIRDDDS